MRRRTFIVGAAAGGAVLATTGLSCARRPTPPTPVGLKLFTADEAATLGAVASRLVAPLDVTQLRVVQKIDALLSAADGPSQHDFKQLLWLFDSALAGLAFDGRFTRFRDLPAEDQDLALTQWRDSRISDRRSGFQALQRLCLAVCYSDPALYPGIGYPGPPALVRKDGSLVGGGSP